ncbi:tetratricopeptide repeat protein [Candidatus Riflebacteria bacterium]
MLYKKTLLLWFFIFPVLISPYGVWAAAQEEVSLRPLKIEDEEVIGTLLFDMRKKRVLLELPGFFPVDSAKKWRKRSRSRPGRVGYTWWIFQNSTSNVKKWVVYFKKVTAGKKQLYEAPEHNYRGMKFQWNKGKGRFLCTETYNGAEFSAADELLVQSRHYIRSESVHVKEKYHFPGKLSARQKINLALFLFEVGEKEKALKTIQALQKSPERDYFLGYLLVKYDRYEEAKTLLTPLLQNEDNEYAVLANSLLIANEKNE